MKSQKNKRECILTVDLEEWYHGAYPGYNYGMVTSHENRVVPATRMLLKALAKYDVRATFFVLGEVAKSNPELIMEIRDGGHEIASHGMRHIQANILGMKNFGIDLVQSLDLLEKITGYRPKGFRAANFSLNPQKTPWAFDILKQYSIEYDSSVFPAVMYYGGASDFSRFITEFKGIHEFPPSCFRYSKIGIAFSGGFYIRILPKLFIQKGINTYHKFGETPVLYIHPKDIDPKTPKLPLGFTKNFAHRGLCKNALDKFEWLLNSYRMISIRKYLDALD